MEVGSAAEPVPEAVVPDNPNAVVFAVDARAHVNDRPWAALVRDAVEATRDFHAASSLPILAGWAWRVALDRKNQRHFQLLLWAVLDGPATAAHLDALERGARRVAPGCGPGCIERVPVNGAAAVLWRDGSASFPWHPPGEHPEPWAVKLTLADGHVRPLTLLRSTATADDVPPELRAVLAADPVYGDDQRRDEQLRLAFAMHFTDTIVAADGVVRDQESAFVANLFPPEVVRSLGLEEPAVRREHFDEACTVLRERLGHHDKLALIGLFFSACYSDGTLDAREMRVLKEAGEQLGLTKEEVVKYLRRFW